MQNAEILMMFAAIGGALVAASLAGAALEARGHAGAAALAVENFNARIKGWWRILAILAGAILFGKAALIALFATISFFALREFLTLTKLKAADHRVLLACYLIVIPIQYGLIVTGRVDLFRAIVPLGAAMILPMAIAASGEIGNFFARTAELFVALMICVYCISHVPAVLMLPVPGGWDRAVLLMLFQIVIAQSSDVFQYAVGKTLGRHRIAPRISPGKTVEGTIGGIACSAALGAALRWMTPFTWPVAIGLALLIAVAGFLGGLVMSAIKRDRGVKDWGRMIPGHGGVLDRVDSLCFSAPIFFYVVRYLIRS